MSDKMALILKLVFLLAGIIFAAIGLGALEGGGANALHASLVLSGTIIICTLFAVQFHSKK